MISEFETRLAELLGSRLPAPFTGRVHIAPAPEGDVDPELPALRVGVTAALPKSSGFGASALMQIVKGASAPRRVLALNCQVRVEVFPLASDSATARATQLQLLETAAFELGATDMRDGGAFEDQNTADPGFLVQKLHLRNVELPFGAQLTTSEPSASIELVLDLDGWFWPVGQPGESGIEIQETRIRGLSLPISLEAGGDLVAGGAAVDYTLKVGTLTQAAGAAFSSVVVSVNSGSLSSPDALAESTDTTLLLDVSDGGIHFLFSPPAESGNVSLRVAFDNAENEAGLQIAEFSLKVGAAD